jgi:hypothetical protein
MGADGNLANDLAANSEDPTCRGMERAPCDWSVWVVRNLPLNYFWRKLVEHFDILWQQNKIELSKGQSSMAAPAQNSWSGKV